MAGNKDWQYTLTNQYHNRLAITRVLCSWISFLSLLTVQVWEAIIIIKKKIWGWISVGSVDRTDMNKYVVNLFLKFENTFWMVIQNGLKPLHSSVCMKYSVGPYLLIQF